MDSFEALVKKYRRSASSEVIHNASKKHAEVLIKNLLQDALGKKENIKIVSGSLEDGFYNNLAGELEDCLDAGIEVDVVVLTKRDLSNNLFAEKIKENLNGRLFQNDKEEEINLPHFILVGGNKFRVEIDHNQTKAMASFNGSSIGETLSDVFERIKKCIPLSPSPA